jgi:ABC-type phosphate transport system substrate-binding protein
MKINHMIKTAAVLGALISASAAQAELVVVVNPANAAASMTAEQVADVFLGKSTSLTPVDQANSSASRGQFYTKVTGKDAAQVKAIWARLIFTGKATPPKEVGTGADVKKAVASDPKAIGYIDKSEADGSVKTVLSIN